jgi:DNA-binding response OmpR family regulator
MADILLVADDPSLHPTLRAALATDGMAPVLATAHDALDLLRAGTPPDAVVVDLDALDTRTGGAVLVLLEGAMAELVPIVALSSRPRRLLEAGIADAVVLKPFEALHLRACVHRVCEQPRGAL